jgi:formylglycine-generating enzyme required for sulfatase activity
MKFVRRAAQVLFVSVGIILLTSFSIDATDTLRGSQTALSIFANKVSEAACPVGMARIDLAESSFCVDVYENGASDVCPHSEVLSLQQTQDNLNQGACNSVSSPATNPWTYVSYHQAKTLCAKRGARLPSAKEWYEAALGTPDSTACNINGSLAQTGSFDDCISARGMHDMVGNVWEWVDEEVSEGMYHERSVPSEGYVTEVDAAGVAVLTNGTPSSLYGSDYFWSDNPGTFALMRGGFHGSREDGGVYTVHAKVTTSFASVATGFRCVQNI